MNKNEHSICPEHKNELPEAGRVNFALLNYFGEGSNGKTKFRLDLGIVRKIKKNCMMIFI